VKKPLLVCGDGALDAWPRWGDARDEIATLGETVKVSTRCPGAASRKRRIHSV
jgi:hypothetical protein